MKNAKKTKQKGYLAFIDFIDFNKAFDTVGHENMMAALKNQRISSIRIIEAIQMQS